jgi:hypothetical protein
MLPDTSESTVLPHEGGDFRVLATADHAEFHHAGHFLAETHAAGALDAARHLFHRDQRTGFFRRHHAFFFFVARVALAVAERPGPQLAFAAPVAELAKHPGGYKQELHHRLLCLHRLVAVGAHDHARRDRGRAGRHRFRRLFHFDQAHAAVRSDRQFLVIAEVRDIGPEFVCGVHHHGTWCDFDFFAV